MDWVSCLLTSKKNFFEVSMSLRRPLPPLLRQEGMGVLPLLHRLLLALGRVPYLLWLLRLWALYLYL